MKHLVIITDGVTSKRITAVEMARRLSRAGYRITIVGTGGEYSRIDDFAYYRIDLKFRQPADVPSKLFQKFGRTGRWFWNSLKRHERRAEVMKTTNLQSFYSMLRDLSPDLLVIDIEAHLFVLAAIAQDIPVVLFSVFFNLWKDQGVPPLHTSIIPGKGFTGHSLLIKWSWLRLRFWKFLMNMKLSLLSCGMDRLSLLKCYAKSLGIRLEDHVDCSQWLIPFLYLHLPVLVLNPEELEFPLSPAAITTYVGPMICVDRSRRCAFFLNVAKFLRNFLNCLISTAQGIQGGVSFIAPLGLSLVVTIRLFGRSWLEYSTTPPGMCCLPLETV